MTRSGILNLYAALGAFIDGIVVVSARETEWVHTRVDVSKQQKDQAVYHCRLCPEKGAIVSLL